LEPSPPAPPESSPATVFGSLASPPERDGACLDALQSTPGLD